MSLYFVIEYWISPPPALCFFDSELSVRGSSQGLPSLINEVMEHVEKGSNVGGIYI